jgi:hypothetical protein
MDLSLRIKEYIIVRMKKLRTILVAGLRAISARIDVLFSPL